MRIALINTPSLAAYGKINTGHHCSFPLGLGYIASFLRKHGHPIIIADPEAAKEDLETMWKRISDFQPDLVGITSVTANFHIAQRLATEARLATQCRYVVMGGPHVTALPKSSLLGTPALDAVIQGEGELPMQSLAAEFDSYGRIHFDRIPGATFLTENQLVQIPRPPRLEDISVLPLPARDLVDLSWYSLHPHFQRGRRSATILSSRGCPSRCNFCGNGTLGRRFRPTRPDYFVDELEILVRDHGIRHFHIVDDCFTVDMERVERICDLILERGLAITWFIFGRVDTLTDRRIILKMKKAGLIYVLLGIESGNQSILDTMKKDITLEMAETCCKLLKSCDIRYVNSFIIGNEGETWSSIEETIDFAIRLKSVFAGFNILIPFPGTYLFHQYYADYDRPDQDWSQFCSIADDIPYTPRQTVLTREQLLRATSHAYRRFYCRPHQLLLILRFCYSPAVFFAYLHGAWGLLRQTLSWVRKSRA